MGEWGKSTLVSKSRVQGPESREGQLEADSYLLLKAFKKGLAVRQAQAPSGVEGIQGQSPEETNEFFEVQEKR
jgi:hypothetical protein